MLAIKTTVTLATVTAALALDAEQLFKTCYAFKAAAVHAHTGTKPLTPAAGELVLASIRIGKLEATCDALRSGELFKAERMFVRLTDGQLMKLAESLIGFTTAPSTLSARTWARRACDAAALIWEHADNLNTQVHATR